MLLTISKIQSSEVAAKYFEGQNARELAGQEADGYTQADYYQAAEGAGEPPGRWLDGGLLGLDGETLPGQLKALLDGVDPTTGKELVHAQGDNRVNGFDLTFSSPKTVSSVYAVADPELREAIEAAHHQAVRAAKDYLDQNAAYTRRGHGGAESEKLTTPLIAAEYRHSSSRNEDPQLHSHVLVANVCQAEDGTWLTLDGAGLYGHSKAAGVLYQAELGSRLRELGFEIQHGKTPGTVEITGVPEKLTEKWSSRHKEIEDELAALGRSGAQAAQIAQKQTRQAKQYTPLAELRERWSREAKEHGFGLEAVRGMVINRAKPLPWRPSREQTEALLDSLTSQNSTFQSQKLTEKLGILAAREAPASLDAEALRKEADRLLQDKAIVKLREDDRGQPVYSTLRHRETERSMIRDFGKMVHDAKTWKGPTKEQVDHAIAFTETEGGFTFTAEQRRAVETVCREGRLATLTGIAGSGKTTILNAVRRAHEAAGIRVVGIAPTHRAKDELAAAGIESQTVAGFLSPHQERSWAVRELQTMLQDGAAYQPSGRVRAEAALRGLPDDWLRPKAGKDGKAELPEVVQTFSKREWSMARAGLVGREARSHAVKSWGHFLGHKLDLDSDLRAKIRGAPGNAEAKKKMYRATHRGQSRYHQATADNLSERARAIRREMNAAKKADGRPTLYVLDEAGKVGTPQFAQLSRITQERGGKLLLSGDDRQLHETEAGGSFTAAREIALGSGAAAAAELTEIRRQGKEWQRQAVADLAEGRAKEALAGYAEHGQLDTGDRRELMAKMVKDWSKDGGTGYMLVSTNKEAHLLNTQARKALQEDGKLGRDAATVRNMQGEIGVTPGDKIIIRANVTDKGNGKAKAQVGDRGGKVTNGTAAEITSVKFDRDGHVTIEAREWNERTKDYTGRKLTWRADEFQDWHHPHAGTTHLAQGRTDQRDYALLDLSTSSPKKAQGYVALSRHREDARVYLVSDGLEGFGAKLDRDKAIAEAAKGMSRDDKKTLATSDQERDRIAADAGKSFTEKLRDWADRHLHRETPEEEKPKDKDKTHERDR